MKRFIILLILIFTINLIYANREISGTISSNTLYIPGTTIELEFVLNFTSPDAEYVAFMELTFPTGMTPVGTPADIGTFQFNQINGNTISWGAGFGDSSMGYLSANITPVFFSCSVDISSTISGEQTVAYYCAGDVYGAEPHEFSGNCIVNRAWDNDLVAVAVIGDPTPIAGIEETYQVVICNQGINVAESYAVELYKDDTSIGSVVGPSIANGEYATLDFTWIPDQSGYFTLSGVVTYDEDEFLENNQTEDFNVEVSYWDGIIGDGDEIINTIPANYYWKNSLTEQIYYQNEVQVHGRISSIEFFYNFSEVPETTDLNIWVGETTRTDLSDGFIPASELTLVHSGPVYYEEGDGVAYISLSQPYLYWGGNLVILVQRPLDTQYYDSGVKFYYTTDESNPNRTVEKHSDVTEFDPDIAYTDGNLLADYSNTRFYFYPEESGAIQGAVTCDGNPVSDVLVEIEGTQACAITNENGIYTISQAYTGIYNLKASKPGFIDTTIENIEVQVSETTTANITISPLLPVNVSGYVFGNNDLENGLEGADVTLIGDTDYETITQANGSFSFSNIPANATYNISVTLADFYNYSGSVIVDDTDQVLEDIVLVEYAYSVSNLRGGYNEVLSDIYLLWDVPENINRSLEFYRIYRFPEMYQNDHDQWGLLADEYSETSYTDSTFGSLEAGNYKYAIVAVYSNDNISYPTSIGPYFEPIFSPVELLVEATENALSLTWQAPDIGEREDRTINKPDDFDDSISRDLFAYNIYLDNILHESELTSTNYIFEEIDTTVQHQIGVSALYESGFESEVTSIIYDPVDFENDLIPQLKNSLEKNYPNPFNPSTVISFTTKSTKAGKIEIYNIKGEKIVTLSAPMKSECIEGRQANSTLSVTWNGTDQSGNPVSSGLYLYKLKVGNRTIDTKKMMLLK